MNRINILRPNDHTSHPMMWHLLLGLMLLIGAFCASTAQAQARFSYSTNGAEVTDSKTGLIWQRCSAGQSWSASTCTGTATTFTHETALTYAQTQTGWRLPNVKELSSLADRTVNNPCIDSVAFPATPATEANWYWSASPYAGNPASAWIVNFYNGIVKNGTRDFYGYHHVRLVR